MCAAAHYDGVTRCNALSLKVSLTGAGLQHAAEKAAEKPSPSQPFYYPPFDEAEYLTRCAEYAALMVLDAGAGCG